MTDTPTGNSNANSLSRPLADLSRLPTDEIRQIMWGFERRTDLQGLVRATRAAARGPVARLVASGERSSWEWSDAKEDLLAVLDQAQLTGLLADASAGGPIEGPKNLAMSLAAMELGWVDGGAATTCLALWRAAEAIALAGTQEQKEHYLQQTVPSADADQAPARGAFCLTEPIPYAGVDMEVHGTVRIAEWPDGGGPHFGG